MSRRDRHNGTQRRRRGPSRAALWTPVVAVATLLAGAAVANEFEVGPTYLGWYGADPADDPAGVDLPGDLALPDAPMPAAVPGAPDGTLDDAAVAAAVQPLLKRSVLGRSFAVHVAGMEGAPIFSRGDEAVTPASTLKVLTAVAALETLGPEARFTTSVEMGERAGEIVLVGGGDPFLAAEPASIGAWPEVADLETLARATAEALAEREAGGADLPPKLTLRYDTTLFSGPEDNPEWEASYVAGEVVSPITSLWVDEGRDPAGWGRVDDPGREAAQAFARALDEFGVTVSKPRPGQVQGVAEELASVQSAPLEQIVQRLIDVSDNEATEVVARHVGLAVNDEGSFEAGAAAVTSTLAALGIDVDGMEIFDGSGLSRQNKVRAVTLIEALQTAASPAHPHLRAAVDGLPVAGFTGSLTNRFAVGAEQGLGLVRAKTGTLTGVHGLAGLTQTSAGVPLIFVAVADEVPVAKTLDARAMLDRIGAELAACACVGDLGAPQQ